MVADSIIEGHMRTKQRGVFASWHTCYCVLTNSGQLQLYTAKHKGAGQVYMVTSMTVEQAFAFPNKPEKGKVFLLASKEDKEKKEGFYLGPLDPSDHQAWVDAFFPSKA